MTTAKAIEILEAYRKCFQALEGQPFSPCEALEMAIVALQENKEHKETVAHNAARLQHLLQSDFIKSFDAIRRGEYVRDIKEADRLGALIDVYAGKGGFEFPISQIKDLIKDRESFLQGDYDSDRIYKNDIIALQTAITALQTHDEAVKIKNRMEHDGAESLNREVYNRLQDIIKLYPYPLGGKNFEEWDGSGD